jgi:hypothetical protein
MHLFEGLCKKPHTLALGGTDAALQATALSRGRFGLVEEFPSPWDATQLTVLVSGSAASMLPSARRALIDGKLSGSVALVDAAGNSRSIATGVRQDTLATARAPSSSRPIRALAFVGIALALLQVLVAAGRGINKKGSRA